MFDVCPEPVLVNIDRFCSYLKRACWQEMMTGVFFRRHWAYHWVRWVEYSFHWLYLSLRNASENSVPAPQDKTRQDTIRHDRRKQLLVARWCLSVFLSFCLFIALRSAFLSFCLAAVSCCTLSLARVHDAPRLACKPPSASNARSASSRYRGSFGIVAAAAIASGVGAYLHRRALV